MKPFNLEEAKAGKPVCTREGNKVRIICFDFINSNYPIVALILMRDVEKIITYTENGKFYDSKQENINDLMMATEKHEGWINIYKNHDTGGTIFSTFEKAVKYHGPDYVATVKIEWEE